MSVISKLYNGNVYMNGNNLAGTVEEATMPDLKPKTTEHKALSNIGSFDLPTGIDKMSMKLKFNTVNPYVMGQSADFYNAQDVMIRSNIDNWEGGSKVSSVPLVAQVRGLSRKVPELGIKHQDNVESDMEFNVTAYKLEIDGQVIYDIDLFANVYIVNGVDKLADYRANLGL